MTDSESDGAILLVEDTEEHAFLTEKLLHSAGTKVAVAKFTCPVEAIDWLTRRTEGPSQPLACFLDIKIPMLSGFEVLEWIRNHYQFDNVPVVMLSASDEPRDVLCAQKLRADCFVKKFPSVPEMARVLAEALRFRDSPSRDFALPCNLLSTLPPA